MSSYEHEVSRWNLRHDQGIEELLEPVVSPCDASRFVAEKPLSGIDQCLHVPGKADSAYSSFSGGSNLPEYPVPLCYTEDDPLPLDQLPYMDSGYVRSIYNPSAMNAELRQMHENKEAGKSSHYRLEKTGHSQIYGITPVPGMSYQARSPLAGFSSPLPHPPSPPARVDSCEANRNEDQPPGICFYQCGQAEGYIQNPSKGLPFDPPANCCNDYWLSRYENESSVREKGDIWYSTHPHTTKKSNSPIFTKSSAILEETLRSNSSQKILWAQNTIHTYKIPEAMNSFPSLQASHNAVNDTQENKQYLYSCSVHKPPFGEADLPGAPAGSSTPERELDSFLCPSRVDDHSGLEQDIYKCSSSSKYITGSLPNDAALRIINNYEEKKCSFSSKEETGRDVWHPLLKQQTRMQKPPSHDLSSVETPHSEIYETTSTVSCYSQDAEDNAAQPFNFRKAKENDNNSSPDLLVNPRQEETLEPVHFPNPHWLKKPESQSQHNSASTKINRKTTPLLYYLSGGKNSNFMTHKTHKTLEQEDVSTKSPRSNCPVPAAPIEMARDNNTHMDDTTCTNERLMVGSPASSVDDAFKNDYREKLKIAQSKVLRETSFKRKDLQMSLPVRLKPRPSSRPSIQHLRSMSLSSSNEDSKPIPTLKQLENLNREDESKRPETNRIKGRKRATAEQKKISYSEPEKLNQLDDHRDQSASWKKKNARSRSDEVSEQDSRVVRSKALEGQGRALSKAELKQIQHNALLEYMERKTGQRPTTANHSTQQKPPLQQRASDSKRFPEDRPSNSSTSRKLPNTDGFCPHPVPGHIPELFSFPSALTSANSKVQPSGAEGSCASNCALEKSLLHSDLTTSSKGHGKSKSTTSPVQDFCTSVDSTTCPALSTQDHGYYSTYPSPLLKENVEVDKQDNLGIAKQGVYVAGRRGKSMEETGSSERVKLSPLSQSTDQLHHLKGWHVFSGLETSQSNWGVNHQNVLQNCESTSRCLLRQSSAEDTTSLGELNPAFHVLEAPHSTKNNKLTRTFISLGKPSLGHTPLLPEGSRFPSSNIPVEPGYPSPVSSPGEVDSDVFKNSLASGSETASDPLSFCGQTQCSMGHRKVPEPASPASALQSSTKGRQITEEQDVSFPLPEKEEANFGESGDNENSLGNSYCSGRALESTAFFLKEKSDTNSQLKKEISEKSHTSCASQWQHLEANDTTHPSENRTYYCAALLDNQEHENTRCPFANSEALQNERESSFPMQDTGLFMAQSKSPEDQRCEDLAVEIIAKDKSLVDILMPYPMRKTALDLMEGLFPVNISVLDRSCRQKVGIQIVQENDQRSNEYATDPSHGTEKRRSLDDPEDITAKKKELISNIQLKLQALWDKRELIQREAKEHAAHGKELESVVQGLCKPNEYERYLMFIGDLEKVVSLLLCLSSRLARVQNAMEKTDENTDPEEKHSLNERHRLLSRQREDAKDLKENLDRRERVVSGILSKYMTESQLQDYRHFVQEKTSLLIEQKDLEEQITFLEEQLERLEKSIIP